MTHQTDHFISVKCLVICLKHDRDSEYGIAVAVHVWLNVNVINDSLRKLPLNYVPNKRAESFAV